MNKRLMAEYITFVADRLLVALGADKHYNTPNPFDWMELLSLQCVPPFLFCRGLRRVRPSSARAWTARLKPRARPCGTPRSL